MRAIQSLFYAATTFLLFVCAQTLLEMNNQRLDDIGQWTMAYSATTLVGLIGSLIFVIAAVAFAVPFLRRLEK